MHTACTYYDIGLLESDIGEYGRLVYSTQVTVKFWRMGGKLRVYSQGPSFKLVNIY